MMEAESFGYDKPELLTSQKSIKESTKMHQNLYKNSDAPLFF